MKKHRVFFLCMVLFFVTRVIYLDRDLPPGEMTQFGEKDEQAYNFTALNLYHFGALSKKVNDEYSMGSDLNFILNNGITYATLMLFGNNYFGLRMSAVLTAMLIWFLFYRATERYSGRIVEKGKRSLQWLLALVMLGDLGFVVCNRNAAPTVFRTLFILLVTLYLSYAANKTEPRQRIHFFLIGVIASLLVFFSYFTNAFICLGVFVLILLSGMVRRQPGFILRMGFFALIGMIAGSALSELFFRLIQGDGLLNTLAVAFDDYGWRFSRIGGSEISIFGILSILHSGVAKLVGLFAANLFVLNPTLLFFFFLSLFLSVYLIIKRRISSPLQLATLAMIIAFAMQAFFYNPHPSKWINMIVPVLLLFIYANVDLIIEHQVLLARYLKESRGAVLTILTFLFALVPALIFFRYLKMKIDHDLWVIFCISSILFITIFAMMVIRLLRGALPRIGWIFVILGLTVIPATIVSVKYCLWAPAYHFRDSCISIGKIIGKDFMAGAWTDGHRLYTEGNVLIPWNHNPDLPRHKKRLIDIFTKNLAQYTIAFESNDFIDISRDINGSAKNFRLENVATFYLGKGSMGRSIILYKRVAIPDASRKKMIPATT